MPLQRTFDLRDAREFIEAQLSKNAEMDDSYLTIEDQKWFIAQLIQVEQVDALKRIATSLEGLEAR